MHSVQSASHLKSNNRVTSRVAVSGPTGRSPSLCTSGHLVTVAALRTFTPSLRCLTNRKRGLISARRARAAKKRKKRKRKKKEKKEKKEKKRKIRKRKKRKKEKKEKKEEKKDKKKESFTLAG